MCVCVCLIFLKMLYIAGDGAGGAGGWLVRVPECALAPLLMRMMRSGTFTTTNENNV